MPRENLTRKAFLRAIAGILVFAMHALKTIERGMFVGCNPQTPPVFLLRVGKMYEHAIALKLSFTLDKKIS